MTFAGRRLALAHNDFQLTFPAAAGALAAATTPEGLAFRLTLRRGLAEFFSIPLDQVLYNGASFAPLRRRSILHTAAAQRSTLLPTAASADGLITLLEQLVHQSCLGVEHVVSHTDDTSTSSWDAMLLGESQDTLLDNTMGDIESATTSEQLATATMVQISMTTLTAAQDTAATPLLAVEEGVIATSRRLLATLPPSMSPPSYPATYGSSPSSYPSPASYPAISYPPTACPSLAGGAITALSDVSPYEYFLLTTPLTWSEAVKACTTRSASLAYITTPAELAAVTAFMTANAVRNAWLQLVSSNMVPFPQYYDDVSAGHTQYAMLAAAANGSTLPLVLTKQMSGNGTSVVLDSCTVSHSIVCKWTPSPPPPMPYPPPVMAPPAVSLANVATFVSTMSATLQLDYASLVADPAKLASFMTSYSAAILASLKNAKACNVTGVQSGSVVVAYTVTFLASDFASTDALSAYIATTFGSAANFFSLFPTSFTSAFNVTGASNVIFAVGYACTGSGCPTTAAKQDDKPLIIGLVVGIGGGLIVIIGVVAFVLVRRRRSAAGRRINAISPGSAVTAMQAAPESPAAAASDMMAAKATPPPAPIPFPVLAPKATVAVITPEPESPRLAPGPAAPVHAAGAEASVATPEPAKPVLTSSRQCQSQRLSEHPWGSRRLTPTPPSPGTSKARPRL
ncbi:MAG: hypothetical protein WDW36_009690 [Sanguina aurantia]